MYFDPAIALVGPYARPECVNRQNYIYNQLFNE